MAYPSSQALAVRHGGRHTECACYFFLPFALAITFAGVGHSCVTLQDKSWQRFALESRVQSPQGRDAVLGWRDPAAAATNAMAGTIGARIRRSVQKKAWTMVRPRIARGADTRGHVQTLGWSRPIARARKSGSVQIRVAHRAGAG
jgi:hypothetical protein